MPGKGQESPVHSCSFAPFPAGGQLERTKGFFMDEAQHLKRTDVVTAFLRHAGRVLLVRRSGEVGSYQGRWSGISGYLEDPTALEQALREIREETGLSAEQVDLIAAAAPLAVPAPELETLWVVHPFLFEIADPDAIALDWENLELCWATPAEVETYETVPALAAALRACLAEEAQHE